MDALKRAEESMVINMENGEKGADNAATRRASEITIDGDLMDETAARKAIEEGGSSSLKSSGPGFSTATDANGADESVVLGEGETKLLGLKDGGRMKKILDSDRAKKEKKEKMLGVKLWDDTPRPTDRPIEFNKPEFPSSLVDDHPVIRLLGNAWRNWGKWPLALVFL